MEDGKWEATLSFIKMQFQSGQRATTAMTATTTLLRTTRYTHPNSASTRCIHKSIIAL